MQTENKPAMEVKTLSFAYGKNRVLKDISFRIKEGDITTIMGANGCGKTTLFSLMTRNLYLRRRYYRGASGILWTCAPPDDDAGKKRGG